MNGNNVMKTTEYQEEQRRQKKAQTSHSVNKNSHEFQSLFWLFHPNPKATQGQRAGATRR
jgi:hypothetical protein